MNNKVTIISGSDYNINGIQQLGDINNAGVGKVVKFNKFGYVGIYFQFKEHIIKRHLSDCEDIRSIAIGQQLSNLVYKDNRWVVLHNGVELPSEDVWVIKLYDDDGDPIYMSRSEMYGYATYDITKAWFTFDRQQAFNYANKQSIIYMRAYSAVRVEDEITLQYYE